MSLENIHSQIRSMTGFARVTGSTPLVSLEIEVRSVNHRFLEITAKLPKVYSVLEAELRSIFQRSHRRGRIDLFVNRKAVAPMTQIENSTALDGIISNYIHVCKQYGVSGDHLGGFIGHVLIREATRLEDQGAVTDEEKSLLLSLVDQASTGLLEMRVKEGSWLADDVSRRLKTFEVYCSVVTESSKTLPLKFKQRLEERLSTLGLEIANADPTRLATEVALLADRCDVSEEISRLGSHITQFRAAMCGSNDGVGRKLDFLIQELGRECNTITSKAQDAQIQAVMVDAKAELEKIREQVQNIE